MPTRWNLAVHCGATLLLISFAAACSSAATGSPAGAPGSTGAVVAGATAPGQAQGGGAGSVNDGLGHPVNICTLLPVATVASVTGEPLTVATEGDTLSYKIYSCDYTSADGTVGLTVDVLALDASAGYDADIQAHDTGWAKPISGLGDKAFSHANGAEALFGNVSISVSDLKSASAAETLIRTLQPKL